MARILSADHKGLRGKAEAVRKAMEEPHLPAESSGLGLLISSQWPWWGAGRKPLAHSSLEDGAKGPLSWSCAQLAGSCLSKVHEIHVRATQLPLERHEASW